MTLNILPEGYHLYIFIRREPRRPFFPRALRVPLRFLRIDLLPPVAGFDPNNPPNRLPTLFFTLLNMLLVTAPLGGAPLMGGAPLIGGAPVMGGAPRMGTGGGADILYYHHILPAIAIVVIYVENKHPLGNPYFPQVIVLPKPQKINVIDA